jgi:hypothetical protein
MPGFNNGGIVPAVAGRQATGRGGHQNQNPAYSNRYKIFNNWNVCYSHGFDVKDGHNSLRVGSESWITRKVSLAKIHKHTSMQDMLQALKECIETFYQLTFDGVGQR